MTFLSVTPYLYYADAAAALDWLERVFGFGPRQTVAGDGGRRRGGRDRPRSGPRDDDAAARPGPAEGGGALVIVAVTDVDELRAHILAAGVGVEEPRDEDYGPRTIHVTDPWGYRWYFWQGDAVYPG